MTTNERTGVAGAMPGEQASSATDHNARPDADYRNLENVRRLLERGGEVNVGEVLAALAWALEEIKRLEPVKRLHATPEQIREAVKRANENSKHWTPWSDPVTKSKGESE